MSRTAEEKVGRLRSLRVLRTRRQEAETHRLKAATGMFGTYIDDPEGFIGRELGEHLWSKQAEIVRSVRDNRYTAVRSCHGPGKSFTAARTIAWWLSTRPAGEAFAVTTAPTFNQVRAILWREINRAHRRAGLPGRTNLTEWWMGQELVGMGRKPDEYDPDAFQGIHARWVLVVLDEACGIPKTLWDAVDTLVTNEESRVLAIGNPDDPTGQFAKVCKPNSGWNVLGISAFDTPNFTGEEVPEDVARVLLSPLWVEERRKRWGEGSPLWEAKVLGRFPTSGTDSLIPLAWIERAAERSLIPAEGETDERGQPVVLPPAVLGVDVARGGGDETVIAARRGGVFRVIHSDHVNDTMATAGQVIRVMDELGAVEARVDVIGIGAGVYDRLAEQGRSASAINAGGRTSEPERFVNARAEWYWALREMFERGELDLDAADELLGEQLSNIRYKVTSTGKIQIESKDDMKRRGLDSPDRADALMLSIAVPIVDFSAIVEEDVGGDFSISPL